MTSKDKYREFCKIEKTIPIFSKDWWLDAACGENNWDVILIERNGEIIASFPYFSKKKFGLKVLTMPKLTQKIGPWIRYPNGITLSEKLSHEKKIFSELIKKLPKHDLFRQNFNYTITNWLPFYWLGFEQTTRYKYLIEDLSDLNKVFLNIEKDQGRCILKAQKQLEVYSSNDLLALYKLVGFVFRRQNKNIPYTFEYLSMIDSACVMNNSRIILFAKDNFNNIHAGLYIVFDDISAYGLVSGFDRKFKKSNARSLLLWEGIRYSSKRVNIFDFQGSMLEGVEEHFRSFGAAQKSYFLITRMSQRMKIVNSIMNIVKCLVKR